MNIFLQLRIFCYRKVGCGTEIRFFFGANSAEGFSSHVECVLPSGGLTRILKGGPGCGKSTLMKRVAAEGESIGLSVERFYCSSDPDSLDGVIFPEIGYAIVDGTAPHIVEPSLCAVRELYIDLSVGYDREALAEKADVLSAYQAEGHLHHTRADCLLRATAELSRLQDLQFPCSFPGVALSSRISGLGSESGRCRTVFLSGYTPNGYLTFRETGTLLCPKSVVLRGTAEGCSAALYTLCRHAQQHRWDTILCDSPLLPGTYTEAVLIPGLGLGFYADTPISPFPGKPDMEFGDFPPSSLGDMHAALTELAVRELRSAFDAHTRLEQEYRPFNDFSAADHAAEFCFAELRHLAEKNSGGH